PRSVHRLRRRIGAGQAVPLSAVLEDRAEREEPGAALDPAARAFRAARHPGVRDQHDLRRRPRHRAGTPGARRRDGAGVVEPRVEARSGESVYSRGDDAQIARVVGVAGGPGQGSGRRRVSIAVVLFNAAVPLLLLALLEIAPVAVARLSWLPAPSWLLGLERPGYLARVCNIPYDRGSARPPPGGSDTPRARTRALSTATLPA